MAKRTGDARIVGRAQGGRPDAVPEAHKHIEGERSLVGALAVPIEQIIPDPNQPRKDPDHARLADLSASIKEYGVLQPLLVREQGLLDDGRTQYMIVAGGRRHAAAQRAGLARLPVVVRESEGATLRITQLIENVQRENLAPLEEALAFQELMDTEDIKTVSVLAKRLHVSAQTVSDRLLLLSDQPIADAVRRGQIGPTVARDILRTADEPRAALRERVAAGESLTKTAVKTAREHAAAAGIMNARAKGGGRGKRQTPSTAPTTNVAPMVEDHNRYDPAASDQPDEDLEGALQGVDRVVLARTLAYGAARQLTCEQLLAMVTGRGMAAE